MKRKIILSTLAAILVLFLIYYGVNLVKLNKVNNDEFLMQVKLGQKAEHVGVFDNTLYYTEDNKLRAHDAKKGQLFEKHLGIGIIDLVYDKYIYVAQNDGLIRAYDRFTGEQVAKKEIGESIFHMELVGKELQIYGEKKVFLVDQKLNKKTEKAFDYRPVKYKGNAFKSSTIFLDRDVSGLKSRVQIMEGSKETFAISSVDELFMFTEILPDGSCLFMTNSYLYLVKDGKIQEKTFLMSPKSIDVKDDKIAVIDHDSLKIYNEKLELEKEIVLGFMADKVAIFADKIAIIGKDIIASYENENLIKSDINGMKDYYINNHGIYIVFADRVEKMKGY